MKLGTALALFGGLVLLALALALGGCSPRLMLVNQVADQLASQGHHALMVHAPKAEQSEHVMDLLQSHPISYAQKYRRLVIEDLA